MHSRDVIERLRDPHPAWQNRDVGNKTDIAHQLVALGPRVAPEHSQFPFVRSETKDSVKRRTFAGAVRSDQAEDAALADAEVYPVERDRCSKGFAESACFY